MTTSSTIRNRRPSLLARTGCIAVVALMTFAPSVRAQAPAPIPVPTTDTHAKGDISGNWQGTLETDRSLRIIISIAKTEKGLSAKMYSIDQGGQPINATAVTLDGSAFKCTVDAIGGTYAGTLSADGNSITGTWTQGPKPLPLTLIRATKDTAWEIPAPPPPPKLMAPDADPAFDVVTIKPNNSGGSSMQGLFVQGRNFNIRNGSLADLIGFAYNVHPKQIVNPPDWMDKERYDISGVPDKDGVPNDKQLRVMMQKLLADRFALKFHHEKRDLSAFVLSVGKTGSKLTPTQFNGPLPGFGLGPGTGGFSFNVRNATMPDLTSFLQMLVLDRPVVDQTQLTGRFDFKVTFTPDDSLFNGHPPKLPAPTDANATVEPAPDLYKAFSDQLGLKLEAQKTAVDVIAIDHVEKPSAN
jgi:uncharacterized protein (TIGR03435 family)